MNRFRHGILYAGPVLAYAALIFLVSSIAKFPDSTPSFFGADKLAHFVEYGLFGLLISRWLHSLTKPFFKLHAFWITSAFGILYGLSDEWHQSFILGREASLWDVLFDGLGTLTAAGIYLLLRERTRARNRGENIPETEVMHEQKTGHHH